MERRLRPGDTVEVLSEDEILATFDRAGAVDAMPFMPEMARYLGKRFTVSRRAEKICDTVQATATSRRLRDTVLLDDLRCDGSAHGGCQAGCRIYWKESWLRKVTPGTSEQDEPRQSIEALLALTAGQAVRSDDEVQTYACQATAAYVASQPLSKFDVRQYLREIVGGNVGPLHFARVAVYAMSTKLRRPKQTQRPPAAERPRPLDLQPGEMVEVRSHEEIAATLDDSGRNRGLWFDREMVPFCGGRFRVQDRVERIVNEATGRMINISRDCIVLAGVVCSGEDSTGRWFCPRATYSYWREEWLRRVDQEPSPIS